MSKTNEADISQVPTTAEFAARHASTVWYGGLSQPRSMGVLRTVQSWRGDHTKCRELGLHERFLCCAVFAWQLSGDGGIKPSTRSRPNEPNHVAIHHWDEEDPETGLPVRAPEPLHIAKGNIDVEKIGVDLAKIRPTRGVIEVHIDRTETGERDANKKYGEEAAERAVAKVRAKYAKLLEAAEPE